MRSLLPKINFTRTPKLPLVLLFVCASFFATPAMAQTPGLIFKPATGAGQAVLDPNGNGYSSLTTAGFTTNDKTQSEIPFVPLVFPMAEPTGDLGPGPDCGFTDFVDSGDEDPALSYFNGTNYFFRLRIGKAFPNSKGYSVLIDTDEKFGLSGPNADPNATATNPGFEIEISLQTNFGVFVYNVDGVCPGSASSSFAGETNYQKSIALTTNCSDPDYFYDFYVPFSALTALGITTSTPLRMAIVTQMNPAAGLCNNALSDFGGIDDNTCGSNPFACWNTIINNYPPTCVTCTNSGDRSACPAIASPITTGATSVSGTSTEASGTTIRVFKNSVLVGTTTTSGSAWTLSGLTALLGGDVITATAQASSESVSIANCNPVTVAQTCTTNTSLVSSCATTQRGLGGTGAVGAVIRVYNSSGTLQTPDGGDVFLSGIVTVKLDGTYIWSCNAANNPANCSAGGNGPSTCLPIGRYTITQQLSGQCESLPIYICIGGTATTTPVITTSSILTTATSVSGTSVSGASIILYANGVQIASGTASGTSWTISGLTFTVGQVITARAYSGTNCLSTASPSRTVVKASTAPTVTGTYCTTTSITSVSGTSTDVSGTVIQVFKGAAGAEVINGSTTTVTANGTWTASTGISFTSGQIISARATTSGGTQSSFSNYVTVGTLTTNAVAITTSPISEVDSSVSGTGTNSDVIKLYIDGVQIGSSTTVAGGVWTISSLGTLDLYAGGTVTAAAASPSKCEGANSIGVVVSCVPPSTSLSVSPDSATICSGTTVSNIQISTSTSGIIYQVYNGASTSGSSVLGTGGTITLASGTLSAATTLIIKAIKLGGVTCESFLTENIGVSVNPNPNSALTVTTDASSVCTGTATNVNVQNSESGFVYQLRNNSGNTLVGTTVAGTGGTILLPTGNLSSTTTFNVLVTGITSTFCSATLTTTPNIMVVGNSSAPTASAQTFCGSATVASLTATGTAIQWYAAATGGTGLAGGTALTTATNYFASQTVTGCESARTSVAVTITTTPSAPTAANTIQPTCATATGTIVFTTQSNVEYGINGTYQVSAIESRKGISPLRSHRTVHEILTSHSSSCSVTNVVMYYG